MIIQFPPIGLRLSHSQENANAVKFRRILTGVHNDTPGLLGWHDLRTRKMGDLILVDVHLEIDGRLTIDEGHRIALDARKRVMEQPLVLNLMTHIDPADQVSAQAFTPARESTWALT